MKSFLNKNRNFLINIFFLILLFINTITLFPYFSNVLKYVDEMVEVVMVIYLLFNLNRLFENKKVFLSLVIVFLLLGFISTVVYSYQSIFPALMDATIIIPKFMIGYLYGFVYSKKHDLNFIDIIFGLAQIITIVVFLIAIHDLLFEPFFEKGQFRYFTYSLKLMFTHPTYLSVFCVTLITILTYRLNDKKNLILILMNIFG